MSYLSRQDILEYAEIHGRDAGYALLLLCGPDGFGGDYEEYKELEDSLNDKPCN